MAKWNSAPMRPSSIGARHRDDIGHMQNHFAEKNWAKRKRIGSRSAWVVHRGFSPTQLLCSWRRIRPVPFDWQPNRQLFRSYPTKAKVIGRLSLASIWTGWHGSRWHHTTVSLKFGQRACLCTDTGIWTESPMQTSNAQKVRTRQEWS